MQQVSKNQRRGAPLVLLVVILAGWTAGRSMVWESPFALPEFELSPAGILLVEREPLAQGSEVALAQGDQRIASGIPDEAGEGNEALLGLSDTAQHGGGGFISASHSSQVAAGHHLLMTAAFQQDFSIRGFTSGSELEGYAPGSVSAQAERASALDGGAPPFLAQSPVSNTPMPSDDRWSLDAFAFFRSGSSSLSTAQGRVPVYGASQLAANLQYRLAPSSQHDPRAYTRAYHALVADAETEVAAGLSARPIAAIPLRTAAEVRVVRNRFATQARPAAYAVTEIAPQKLPLGLAVETYAGAGYVGGAADTFFVDGQAGITRELVRLKGMTDQPLRLSLGGAAWGGAQRDAERLDVGPTMRLDMTLGSVPARISVDWRERVAGDAEPTSGIAATLSTRF
ncbi:hypothetical protein NAP1_00415 [Erythrobacter sp. NAP1]|uniref:hypothetical protein n=1 Tax=Erythrobacter sp. NAP1 TaxID=237727 RepID=UPI0000686D27|nr:hypothetical protein [Erythrobacter sp. NAP1]EAQ29189.1 hypothetical protein NAP1_00415 [Erythrobacter sp. NAP1]